MPSEQLCAFQHTNGSLGWERKRFIGAEQLSKKLMDGLKCLEDVALCSPQRGETKAGKLRLQLANIVPAEGKIVSKISGTGAICFVNRKGAFQRRRFKLQHVGAQGSNLTRELLDLGFI